MIKKIMFLMIFSLVQFSLFSMTYEEAISYINTVLDGKIQEAIENTGEKGLNPNYIFQYVIGRVYDEMPQWDNEEYVQKLAIDQIIGDGIEVVLEQIEIDMAAAQELDDPSKRREKQELLDENAQDLENQDRRLLDLPDDLKKYHIYYVRSIHQPAQWLCGSFVLYNAFKIEEMIGKIDGIYSEYLRQQFLDSYLYDNFQGFYANNVLSKYEHKAKAIGKDLETDAGSGLLTIDPQKPSENFLEGNDIESIAKYIVKKFFVLGFIGNQLLVDMQNEKVLNEISDAKGPKNYLKIIEKPTDRKWTIHFFCRSAIDEYQLHWFLISIVNIPGQGRVMFIMDSVNYEIHREHRRYIDLLRDVFEISEIKDAVPDKEESVEGPEEELEFPGIESSEEEDEAEKITFLSKLKNAMETVKKYKGVMAFIAIPVILGLIAAYKAIYPDKK